MSIQPSNNGGWPAPEIETSEVKLNLGIVGILIILVVVMALMGSMTITIITYSVFIALSILAYRFRVKIGMTNSLGRTFLVFGGIAAATGGIGGQRSLSIPGGIFATIGAVITKMDMDRQTNAEKRELTDEIERLAKLVPENKGERV